MVYHPDLYSNAKQNRKGKFKKMEEQIFSLSEMGNLVPLIEENQTNELLKEDIQIKDSDILYFSQYGHLTTSAEEGDIQILSDIQEGSSMPLQGTAERIKNKFHTQMGSGLTSNRVKNFQDDVKNEQNYKLKLKEVDGKSVKSFECGVCGKEFGHQYTLMRHLPTHTDERKFNCPTCGKSFRQLSTLSQHKAIHSTERPYICEVCNKNFNRISTLISHRKTHSDIKPHRCPICNKSFHQKGNLRNHIFTHTNERPYKCDACGKGFNQMSNLMCHKIKAHQQGDLSPRYICRVCGNYYSKRANLRQHEHFRHGVVCKKDESFDNMNAVAVNPIRTKAMRDVLESGATPFALLRPLSGIPVLVRVEVAGERHMLVPATAEDLKKAGHISIKPKLVEGEEAGSSDGDKENRGQSKTTGSVVQISVPVVATIIQQSSGHDGSFNMKVVSPSKEGGSSAPNSVVYSSTLIHETPETPSKSNIQTLSFSENVSSKTTNLPMQSMNYNVQACYERENENNFDLKLSENKSFSDSGYGQGESPSKVVVERLEPLYKIYL
ncbi:zinc finger protein 436-like isoform X2 [Sitophilus oryzae]|uniref:Zinc finger protein 436-like isoform X2 n=1 Tax=Sitophilus oryzae TaxID=7048 RepID=A0A6J2XHU8_SITOR|nr:zinc finger protein 436-like isoform X2 [Sitophilus oryzae]